MRNAFITAAVLIAAVLVAGCAQQVDEELLPTRVPQVDMQVLVQAAEDARPTPRPTPTNTPIPTPTVEDAEAMGQSGDQDSVVITYGDVVVDSAEEEADKASVDETSVDETSVDQTPVEETPVEDVATEAVATDEPATGAASDAGDAAAIEESVPTETPDAASIIAESDEEFEVAPGVEVEVSETETITNTVEVVDAVADSVTETKTTTETDTIIVTVTEVDTVTETVPLETDATDSDAEADTESTGEETGAVDMSLPDSIQTAIDNTDLMRGEQLILTTGCTGCHAMDRDTIFVGPSWYDLATTSANRVEGMSAEVYMYRSILYPNEYIVDGFENSAMLPNYEETLTDQDIGDLIGYMLTLRAR